MIQLNDTAVIALLAVALGVATGLLGGWWLWSGAPSPAQRVHLDFEQEGLVAIEKDRPVQPRDTSGQSAPTIEIRYRAIPDTVVRRDTLFVPAGLGDGVVSDRTPIEVTPDRAIWTYYDPADRRREQRVFKVPSPTWSLDAEAGLGVTVAPLTGRLRGAAATSTLGLNRHWDRYSGRLGVGLTATTDRVGATVSLTLTRTLLER